MGTLVVKAYPTKLLGKAADHTYVECGTGAVAWSCWGGKAAGTAVRQASGSTARANEIAEPTSAPALCIQRRLPPSRQSHPPARRHHGERRAWVPAFEALYGPYGRDASWPYRAPFNQHPATAGDLPACVAPPTIFSAPIRPDLDETDARYLPDVLAIYREFDFVAQVSREERERFHLQLFAHMVDFYLGSDIGDRRQELIEVRWETEQRQQRVEQQATDQPLRAEANPRSERPHAGFPGKSCPSHDGPRVRAAAAAAEGRADRAGGPGGDRTLVMASSSLPYGRRISDEEYDRRVVAFRTLAAVHRNDRGKELRRAELNLALDHRLGQDFPAERRRLLWQAQERIDRHRRRLAVHSLLGMVRTRSIEGAATGLARDLVRAYAQVLTRAELDAFFGDAARDERARSSQG